MSFRKRAFPFTALLIVIAAALPVPASAQPTTSELLFSEYIEGTSNNKALEIYNGTGAPVDLGAGGYNIQMFFNGSTSAGTSITLTGSIAPGGVFVIAHALAAQTIRNVAHQINSASWYNGDDAVVLRKGTTIIDVIGQIGFDPGTEWGTGLASTADNTLRRKFSVLAGDSNGSDVFVPSVQWDGFPTDTFSGLGSHTPAQPITLKAIWEIQGSGLVSPFAGQQVRTQGNVVTAVVSNGFFIQSLAGDGDEATSEGLFVFTGSAPSVAVGNVVTVIATVAEFFELTELSGPQVFVTGSVPTLPEAVLFDELNPPTVPAALPALEAYEGMLVRVENGRVTAPSNEFNEASVVARSDRAFREPGILYPGLPGLPVWDGNPEIFEVNTQQYAPAPGLQIAAGARLTAEGPLTFSFGDYQILPTMLDVDGEAVVVPVRARRPGEFTVGSQNVLRLYDSINDPDTSDDVATPEEFAARLAKLSLHVRTALRSPDVLALQEVENLTTLERLAARINADDPTVHYTAYLLEGNDIGGIDVGFLVRDTVRVDSLEQFGKDDTYQFNDTTLLLNDRPPLVLRGVYIGHGADFPITVINVHQRSLNGIDGNDGARVRAKRHAQAVRLAEFIDTLQDSEPNLKLVVLGDFNAFEFTDGYVDVMGQVTGVPDPAGALLPADETVTPPLTNQTLNLPAAERYSFVFDGSAQSLDHALTSQGVNPWMRGVQHSRGNADVPEAFADDPSTAMRVSDHDGTVVFVTVDVDDDGVPDHLDACAATRIPEGIPTIELKPNHFALVNSDGLFDTAAAGNATPRFTIDETRGCSCEQILERIGVAMGQQFFGCSVGTIKSWIGAAR